jgi:hypothetical protein
MAETYERWAGGPEINGHFGGITVVSHGDGRAVLFLHGHERDLRITFRQVHALTVHEEFAHPLVDSDSTLPSLLGSQFAYPLLVVTDSEWLRSFFESRLRGGDQSLPVHYSFLSLSYFVDVLSYHPPVAEWVSVKAIGVVDSL